MDMLPDPLGDDDTGMDDDAFLGLTDLLPSGMYDLLGSSSAAAYAQEPASMPEQEAWVPSEESGRRRRAPRRRAEPTAKRAAGRAAAVAESDDDSDGKPDTEKVKDRRERNKASARASRRKRKALLEGLAGKVTSLAEDTDRERLARAEAAASGVDRRRAELVASARAALAAAASGSAPPSLARESSTGSTDDVAGLRDTAAAAAAALPALIRERFSMAGAERRALVDFALEHAAATAMPHHLRVIVHMAEQRDAFFTSSDERTAAAEAAKAHAEASYHPAAGGALAHAATDVEPDLWGLMSNELWLSDTGGDAVQAVLQRTAAEDLAAMREAVRANRSLRAALAERAEASAALSASVHAVLTPAQELAFQDFLSRNAERIRRLMPSTARTKSTDEQAAAVARAASENASTPHEADRQLRAAVMVAREASQSSQPDIAGHE